MANPDPGFASGFTALLEISINTALKYDPATKNAISQIEGVLAVESLLPAFTCYLSGSGQGVQVLSYTELAVSTKLKGTLPALVGLLKQPTTLADSGVELLGSIGLLQQWQQVLSQLDIDWEDALGELLGDMASQPLASVLKDSVSWIKRQGLQHEQQLKNYLYEELKLTPAKSELTAFYQQVDQAKLTLDRLEARLNRLAHQRKA